MKNNCIFCENEQVHGKTLFETENFIVRVGLGLITAGHCMIITKEHLPCMAAIPEALTEEYLNLKNKVFNIVSRNFSEPFIAEYGAVFQSVFHAHCHFIPASSNKYKKINVLNDIIIPVSKKYDLKFEEVNFKQLQKIYQQEKEYVYYEQNGKGFLIHTKNAKKDNLGQEISYRTYFENVVKLQGIGNWKTITEQEKIADKEKQNETREAFKNVK